VYDKTADDDDELVVTASCALIICYTVALLQLYSIASIVIRCRWSSICDRGKDTVITRHALVYFPKKQKNCAIYTIRLSLPFRTERQRKLLWQPSQKNLRSSVLSEMPRDASCLSVVSFSNTIFRAQSFIKPPLATARAASCNGPVHLFVCLSVCRQNTKTRFSQKLSILEPWSLLTIYRKSYMGISKNPLLDS